VFFFFFFFFFLFDRLVAIRRLTSRATKLGPFSHIQLIILFTVEDSFQHSYSELKLFTNSKPHPFLELFPSLLPNHQNHMPTAREIVTNMAATPAMSRIKEIEHPFSFSLPFCCAGIQPEANGASDVTRERVINHFVSTMSQESCLVSISCLLILCSVLHPTFPTPNSPLQQQRTNSHPTAPPRHRPQRRP